jgi:uncharacterized protein YdaT
MSKKNVHVVPRDGGWAVQKEGNQRASKVTTTQKEAIGVGREMAKNERSELVVHGQDGRIRQKDSFGNDPNPPKDKR